MIAGKADFSKVICNRFRVSQILLRNGRQAHNGVHRRADIMRHGGEKIGFCPVRRGRFSGRRLELLIEIKHDRQVKHEEEQKGCGNNADQQPVFGIYAQILHRHEAEKRPSSCRVDRGIGEDTFLPAGVEHSKGAGRRRDGFKELLRGGWINGVVRPVKLEETGIFEGMALDDIIAVRINHGQFGVFKPFLREDPFLRHLRDR